MKKIFMIIGVFSVFLIVGCDINDYGDSVDNFLKNNNAAIESTNARSVEGHIKNIEYLMLEAAIKNGSGNTSIFDKLTKYDDIIEVLRKDGISISSNDSIRCELYKISNLTVIEAFRCADMGSTGSSNKWSSRTYSYTKGGHVVRDDD